MGGRCVALLLMTATSEACGVFHRFGRVNKPSVTRHENTRLARDIRGHMPGEQYRSFVALLHNKTLRTPTKDLTCRRVEFTTVARVARLRPATFPMRRG
jgi:hypothetical protein